MKRTCRKIAALAALLTSLQLATVNCFGATQSAALPSRPSSAPTIVATRSSISAAEMAQYQRRAQQSRQAIHSKAAGAGDNKALWIVGGVVVVVGVIALAAGGGGGGGGGGY